MSCGPQVPHIPPPFGVQPLLRPRDLENSDRWFQVSAPVTVPTQVHGDHRHCPHLLSGNEWRKFMRPSVESLHHLIEQHGFYPQCLLESQYRLCTSQGTYVDHICSMKGHHFKNLHTQSMGSSKVLNFFVEGLPISVARDYAWEQWLVEGGAVRFNHLDGEILCWKGLRSSSASPETPQFGVPIEVVQQHLGRATLAVPSAPALRPVVDVSVPSAPHTGFAGHAPDVGSRHAAYIAPPPALPPPKDFVTHFGTWGAQSPVAAASLESNSMPPRQTCGIAAGQTSCAAGQPAYQRPGAFGCVPTRPGQDFDGWEVQAPVAQLPRVLSLPQANVWSDAAPAHAHLQQATQGMQDLHRVQAMQDLQELQAAQGMQATQGVHSLQGVQGEQGVQPTLDPRPMAVQDLQARQAVQDMQDMPDLRALLGIRAEPTFFSPARPEPEPEFHNLVPPHKFHSPTHEVSLAQWEGGQHQLPPLEFGNAAAAPPQPSEPPVAAAHAHDSLRHLPAYYMQRGDNAEICVDGRWVHVILLWRIHHEGGIGWRAQEWAGNEYDMPLWNVQRWQGSCMSLGLREGGEAELAIGAAAELAEEPDGCPRARVLVLSRELTQDGRRAWRVLAADGRDYLAPLEHLFVCSDTRNGAALGGDAPGGEANSVLRDTAPPSAGTYSESDLVWL